jgi:hypothetical protein
VSVDANHGLAILSSKSEVRKAVGGTLRPSDGNPSAPAVARLEFTSDGESHQLRRIRYGALSTADMAAPSRRVREVVGGGAGGR